MRLVSPESWYRAFWLLVEVVRAFALIVLARIWLVQPIVDAIREVKR